MSKPGPRPIRYPVHGRLMTAAEVAEETGIKPVDVYRWRSRHRQDDGTWASMEDVYDHYRDVRDGLAPRFPGKRAKRYKVGRRMMTVADMYEACSTTKAAFYDSIYYYRHDPVTEYHRRQKILEARKTDTAVAEILAVCLEAANNDT